MNQSALQDVQRYERVSDMMLTMHSLLRDRFSFRARLFDISLLVVAVILCSLTFLDPALIDFFKIDPMVTRVVIGICAIGVFLLSVVSLRVEWKERAARHQQACKILAEIKTQARNLANSGELSDTTEVHEFLRTASERMRVLPEVPDSEFLRLKARHLQKMEISRYLSSYPGVPIWLLRLRLRSLSIRSLYAQGEKAIVPRGDDDTADK